MIKKCFLLKQIERGIKLRMKETIIYLLRHSEQYRDCYNFGDTQLENEKIILSIDGEKKAEELSNNPELLNIKELWSSSYSRAIGTAKYIAKKNNLLINIDSRLNERLLRRYRRIKKIRWNKKEFIYYRTDVR